MANADRMCPRSLDEVEGPDEVVGANGFLRRAIAEDRVPSLVLWGPPESPAVGAAPAETAGPALRTTASGATPAGHGGPSPGP